MATVNKPRCAKCRFYYITWEKSHPYGCKKWGFKSPIIPSASVFKASGNDCQVFEPKLPKAK